MLNLFTPPQNTRSKNLKAEKPNLKKLRNFSFCKNSKFKKSWAGELRSLNSSKATKKTCKK